MQHGGLEWLADYPAKRFALLIRRKRRPVHWRLLRQLDALGHVPDSQLSAAEHPPIVWSNGKLYLGEWSKNQGATQFIAVPNGGRMSMSIGIGY